MLLLRFFTLILTFILFIPSQLWALATCPVGTIEQKTRLEWSSRGVLQTFDCAKEDRREYIVLLPGGYGVANAMIPEGGTVPQVVQYQEYLDGNILVETKKFDLHGNLTRLERFAPNGVMILRYRHENGRLEEFSSELAGEKIRECQYNDIQGFSNISKNKQHHLEIRESSDQHNESVEIFDISKAEERKLLFISDFLAPLLSGKVQMPEGYNNIERCFINNAEKRLVGHFNLGNKKILFPKDNPFPLEQLLEIITNLRSDEGKRFLEKYEVAH